MNTGIDSSPPPVEIAGGWTSESIDFFCHPQVEKGKAGKVSSSIKIWYPADADAVVEQQIQDGNEEDPFWCYLWPTARTLAQQVFEKSSEFDASRKTILGHQGTSHPDGLSHDLSKADAPSLQVLETGCGIGLVGLAALAAGATTVTFQDLRSRSVELALYNAQANGFGDRALGETFDWQSSSEQTFDWILASDVLYHTPAHEPLLDFLEGAIRVPHRKIDVPPAQVSPPHFLHNLVPPLSAALAELPLNGSIWIGDPGRRETETFMQLATPRFQIHLFDAAGTPLASPTHGKYQLLVMYPRCEMGLSQHH